MLIAAGAGALSGLAFAAIIAVVVFVAGVVVGAILVVSYAIHREDRMVEATRMKKPEVAGHSDKTLDSDPEP
jgi:NADH:ubiquinone oxidoreductase subunit 6 (subunit J)